jgi:hypothetical protein
MGATSLQTASAVAAAFGAQARGVNAEAAFIPSGDNAYRAQKDSKRPAAKSCAGELHHLGPLLGLFDDELPEIGGGGRAVIRVGLGLRKISL